MNKLTATLLLSVAAIAAVTGSAMAADLMMPMKAPPVMAAPALTNWDGPYVGASVGYGWGTAAVTTSVSPFKANLSGWLAGGQVGYNFHLSDNLVAGVEGDLDWLNETGAYPNPTFTQTINWEGSARGRLGYNAGQFLPYIEAGVAFANSTMASSSFSQSHLHTGWTVGAGVELMLADRLSANVEYRYSDYGSQTYAATSSVHLTDNTARLGLNYHF